MSLLTIGHIAKRSGVTVETIRFYEKQGLLAEPERSASGYRQYPEDTIKRVRFIQRAKYVGFTLKDIAELLTLRREPGSSCADVKLHASRKIDEVDRKLEELQRIRKALVSMVLKCSGSGGLDQCPILEELDLDEE